jgi:hypothetical protein
MNTAAIGKVFLVLGLAARQIIVAPRKAGLRVRMAFWVVVVSAIARLTSLPRAQRIASGGVRTRSARAPIAPAELGAAIDSVDYEVRRDAQPLPLGIYLLGQDDPEPAGIADLRPRTSTAVVVTVDRPPCGSGTSNVTVQGTTLEQPPAQANGGGFNSSMSQGVITLATPLANGGTVDMRFLLGIQQTGNFKFYINIEALP